ncbi:ABC transporter ATP-binding protein [Rhodococcus sp. NPDC058521]|uniref:ABC transporter ATP-binding protein n=1 Tax=Rhodococcus sp. NPDC058521 TaxID=3346536 RepID=UPI0036600D91
MTVATNLAASHASARLRIEGLEVQLGGATIIRGLDLEVPPGTVIGLMGPNGCGKSTVLRTVYRALKPRAGHLLLDEQDLRALPPRMAARRVAALSQQSDTDFDFTVGEIVALGRVPHSGDGRLSTREQRLCDHALARLGISHLRDRGILGLSGGERQRVLIARALVQEPELLVLDEPTNHLDIAHQVELLAMLRDLEISVLVVLHDLNLAAAVCDRIHFMQDGVICASGTPGEVMTTQNLLDVFGVPTVVVPHPLTGDPQVLFTLDTHPSHSHPITSEESS